MSAARMSGSVDGVAPSRAPIGAVSTPDPIGEQLAALQRAMDAELEAVKAKYRPPMTDLRAAFARARVQRSAA